MREPRSPEPVGRSSAWTTVAAVILALQGVDAIFYSGFLPGPDVARVSVPVLGSASVPWLALGVLALAAAFGVYRRRVWGRVLGGLSEAMAIGSGILFLASTGPLGFVYLVVPCFVIVVLWRRWPPRSPS